ncbi:PREDICTED: early light-induced protein, chloroplastic-like [Lupinus angustifolius]|uniref:early light-induced protein, chloroplastic-like n=1 Tax=Lupinus angustifolius TaxID=3871 RepID=UPI00092E4ACB|nr:PREDICTED: early light-induced protein, chloroplastic-like [Lupinus angustifolius]
MAATSNAMQSILSTSSPVTRVSSTSRGNQFCTPAMYISSLRNHSSLRVRSMAEEEEKEQPPTPVTPPPLQPPLPQFPPLLASTRSRKLSTRFMDVMAFDGPAPERINGRLAMIGFISAIAVELAKGQGLFEQISNGGIAWFWGTSVVISIASLIPLLRGVSVESTSGRIMTSDAELWNGRFAMLGIVALAFTEYIKGGPLV